MTLLMNKLRQRNIEPLPFLNSSKPVWDLERSESKSSWITWSTWNTDLHNFIVNHDFYIITEQQSLHHCLLKKWNKLVFLIQILTYHSFRDYWWFL